MPFSILPRRSLYYWGLREYHERLAGDAVQNIVDNAHEGADGTVRVGDEHYDAVGLELAPKVKRAREELIEGRVGQAQDLEGALLCAQGAIEGGEDLVSPLR